MKTIAKLEKVCKQITPILVVLMISVVTFSLISNWNTYGNAFTVEIETDPVWVHLYDSHVNVDLMGDVGLKGDVGISGSINNSLSGTIDTMVYD